MTKGQHRDKPMAAIQSLTGFDGFPFNPQRAARAVNLILVLGEGEALAVLRQASNETKSSSNQAAENVLVVARLLFLPGVGRSRLPPLGQGEPDVPALALVQEEWPLFPLRLEGDLPFLLIGGYALEGEAAPPSHYIEECARTCVLRPNVLAPAADPLAQADMILSSPEWSRLACPTHEPMVRLQALRAVSHVLPLGKETEAEIRASRPGAWERCRQSFAALQVSRGVVWSPAINDYEYATAAR